MIFFCETTNQIILSPNCYQELDAFKIMYFQVEEIAQVLKSQWGRNHVKRPEHSKNNLRERIGLERLDDWSNFEQINKSWLEFIVSLIFNLVGKNFYFYLIYNWSYNPDQDGRSSFSSSKNQFL